MSEEAIKKDLASIARRLYKEGFVVAKGGNISARSGSAIFINRSGASFDDIKPRDFVKLGINSLYKDCKISKASSESFLHLSCYRKRKDIKTIIHAHPPFATAFASSHKPLKPIIADFVVEFGKEIPSLGYISPGSKELALRASNLIQKNNALLLKNHGIISCGTSIKEAYFRTALAEETCKVLLFSRQFGTVSFLGKSQIKKFSSYKR